MLNKDLLQQSAIYCNGVLSKDLLQQILQMLLVLLQQYGKSNQVVYTVIFYITVTTVLSVMEGQDMSAARRKMLTVLMQPLSPTTVVTATSSINPRKRRKSDVSMAMTATIVTSVRSARVVHARARGGRGYVISMARS